MGADYIEPDLVSTRTACSSPATRTRSPAPPTSPTTPSSPTAGPPRPIDGRAVTGWFTEDFTLAELQDAARQGAAARGAARATPRYDGRYRIPTFEEVLDLARAEASGGRRSASTPRPSTRRTSDSIGLPLEEPLLAALQAQRARPPSAPVFIQSFEIGNLRQLDRRPTLPLVQLVDATRRARTTCVAAGDPRTLRRPGDAGGAARGRDVRRRLGAAQGPGAAPRPGDRRDRRPRDVVATPTRAGLRVHVYTLRDENQFMATNFRARQRPERPGRRARRRSRLPRRRGGRDLHRLPGTVVEARQQWRAAAAAAG